MWLWFGIDFEFNIEVCYVLKVFRVWNELIVFFLFVLFVYKFFVLKIIKFLYIFIDFKCVYVYECVCVCVCKDGYLSMESVVYWIFFYFCYVYFSKYNVYFKWFILKVFVLFINFGSKRILLLFWFLIYFYRDFIVK